MEQEVKYCKRCDRTLPITEFNKNSLTNDGLQNYCRSCKSRMNKELRERNMGVKRKKVYTNPELAKFTPRQLMDELKSRGYTGTLEFVQVIKLS